jgi:serine/threonine protein kinase
VAHLDLKPENILIGENFVLKIGDFDLSFINGDNNIRSMGTKCYRAPEIAYQTSENPFSADIYSLGIVLFFLLTHGEIPSVDSNNVAEEFTFQEVLQTNNRKYWRDFSRSVQVDSSYFSKDFKFLFERMVHPDPKKRPSLFDVKNSKWYNGRILSKKELEIFMRIYYPTTS